MIRASERAALGAAVMLAAALARAAPIPLSEGEPRVDLRPRMELAEDVAASWTVSDVIDGPASRAFQPPRGALHHVGYRSSAFWGRFTLHNPSAQAEERWLELSKGIDSATLYSWSEQTPLFVREVGKVKPFSERELAYATMVFKVELRPGETRQFLLRLQSTDTFTIAPVLWSPSAFLGHAVRDRLFDGIYLGVLFAMIAYNLFLLFATRDRTYLHYVLFQLFHVATMASIDQTTFQYLWPQSPGWAVRSEPFFAALTLAAAFAFARSFLATREHAPRVDLALRVFAWLPLGGAVLSALLASRLLMFAMVQVMLAGTLLLWGSGLWLWRRRSPNARVFVLAWTLLLLGSAGNILTSEGVLASAALTEYLPKIGSGAEAVLLSIGLAARIRRMREQSEAARQALLEERNLRVNALSRLVNGVAHEVGNPLNFGIGGARQAAEQLAALQAELTRGAQAAGLAEKVQRASAAMELVVAANARILGIVENLRAFLGAREVPTAPASLQEEVEETLALLAARAEQQRVTVVCRFEPLPAFPCHRGELKQVFMNLLKNALQAMPEGGTLTVEGREAGAWLEVTVADTGPGVPEPLRSAIFDPFFTTRPPDEGTGLGLAISSELVRRHGGQLSLAPSAQGATFVVRLPAERARSSDGPALPPRSARAS